MFEIIPVYDNNANTAAVSLYKLIYTDYRGHSKLMFYGSILECYNYKLSLEKKIFKK